MTIIRRVLVQQFLHGYVIRGWNDGTFDVVDDWMLPAAARFETYEEALEWVYDEADVPSYDRIRNYILDTNTEV